MSEISVLNEYQLDQSIDINSTKPQLVQALGSAITF